MKLKNAAMAGFLNVVFPGLGCAYLGRWFYALAYLIWVPLAWIMSVAHALTEWIPDETIQFAVYALILFGFRVRILWDVFFTPYKFAEEHNQKLLSKMEVQAAI
jgi:hypothetical protein